MVTAYFAALDFRQELLQGVRMDEIRDLALVEAAGEPFVRQGDEPARLRQDGLVHRVSDDTGSLRKERFQIHFIYDTDGIAAQQAGLRLHRYDDAERMPRCGGNRLCEGLRIDAFTDEQAGWGCLMQSGPFHMGEYSLVKLFGEEIPLPGILEERAARLLVFGGFG